MIEAVGQSQTVNITGDNVKLIGALDAAAISSVTTGYAETDEFLSTIFGELSGQSTINIELNTENSYWFGNAITSSIQSMDTPNLLKTLLESRGYEIGDKLYFNLKGSVNVSLSNGAKWIYDADPDGMTNSPGNDGSSFENLTLNQGVVVLNDDIIKEVYANTIIDDGTSEYVLADYRSSAPHQKVSITNLKGNGGIFQIDLNWLSNQGALHETATSDFIYVENVQDGSQQHVEFNIAKANLSDMNVGDKLYFAEIQKGTTSFITNADGLIENRADEIYSFNYGTESELSADDYTLWYLTKSLGGTNEYVPFMKGAAFASYSLATDMDRLNKRRGESRYVSGTNDGLWVRYAYTDLGWDNAFDMDKHMVQLGYDREFAEAYGKHYFGTAFDYTHADIDIDGVSGDNNSERYALNLYYTWLADNGLYADFVLKGGLIDSDYDVKNSAGAKIGSDFEQWFYGVSAETGYKFDFANRLFIEPQAQLQFIHLEGDDFTTDGGVKAEIDDLNSLIGRVGFRAGYDFSINHDMPDSNFYIKADVMHEFDGDKGIDMRGRTTAYADEFSGDDTWYDVGIGTDLSITENTKLWIDAEHIFGADYDNTWQINAGARYEF